jgi:hypothetical protein
MTKILFLSVVFMCYAQTAFAQYYYDIPKTFTLDDCQYQSKLKPGGWGQLCNKEHTWIDVDQV